MDRGIRLLREEQTLLPEGYISEKQIGKHRYYSLQKRERFKIVSRHIKKDELEEYRKLIARRSELTRTIKDLQGGVKNSGGPAESEFRLAKRGAGHAPAMDTNICICAQTLRHLELLARHIAQNGDQPRAGQQKIHRYLQEHEGLETDAAGWPVKKPLTGR